MPAASVMPIPDDLIEAYRTQIEGRAVLLFDGICVFCNHTVNFLIHRDPNAILRFVPLQSLLGEQLLARFNAQHGPEGIVLVLDALTLSESLSRRTNALIDALSLLPSPWSGAATVLRLVPCRLRELVYGLIARHRYRIFGRYEACPTPTPEQRFRILGIPT